MPVSISFQWASDGPAIPMVDTYQPDLSVNGMSAVYSYSGPWAFLKLLLTHATPLTEFSHLVDPDPQTLMFVIPTRGTHTPQNPSSLPAKLFVRIILKTHDKEGETIVSLPYFPDAAPLLSNE